MCKFIKLFFLFCLFTGAVAYAQQSEIQDDLLQDLKTSDNFFSGFRIEVDSSIEANYYKHLLYNRKFVETMGWRIHIFSGSGNDAFQRANETRARFLSKYEDIEAYIQYVAPDYKVYVGDCRTRSEVLKLFERIKKDFPYAFLVQQAIEVNTDN